MNINGEIYIHLDDIQAVYTNSGTERCTLAYACDDFAAVLEFLGNDHPAKASDVNNFFLCYIYEMIEIAHNDKRKLSEDILNELHDCVMSMNLEQKVLMNNH